MKDEHEDDRMVQNTSSEEDQRREEEGGAHHSLFPEVDADCGDELGVELVVCVAVQEGGLPNTRVPQGKELYQVVIIPISHSDGHEDHLEKGEKLRVTVRQRWKEPC